jgi:hypothetical protein
MDIKPASKGRLEALKAKAPKMDAEAEAPVDAMALGDVIKGLDGLIAAADDAKRSKLEQAKALLEQCYDEDEGGEEDKKGNGLAAEDAAGISVDSGLTG